MSAYQKSEKQIQTFNRLYNLPTIKSELQALRKDNNEIEELEISTRSQVLQKRETQKSRLLKIGATLEQEYIQEELEFMIPSISETIITFLEKDALEGLITYSIEVLPEKYKQSEKSRAPQLQSQNVLNLLKEETEKNIEQHLGHLNSEDDLKAAYELKLQELKKIEEVAEKKNHSLLPDERTDGSFNQLNELDRLQEERFAEKASIGEPLDVIDTTEEDINRIQATIQEYIDTVHDYKEEIKKFPPINHKTAQGIIKTFQVKTQALRPYTDDKFRRSYPQWFNIIKKKIDISATNASKVSAIAAAHRVNPKTGQPLMRTITKEQIDSMNSFHLNFIVEWFNEENYNSDYWLSKAFEENKCRCLEDRAIDLHDKLSHLS